uniref:Uncharacterized protein n=1 Tax=Anguilla anguilla TaxID=7936 RepID=A0A0E9SGT4_ANGAN
MISNKYNGANNVFTYNLLPAVYTMKSVSLHTSTCYLGQICVHYLF